MAASRQNKLIAEGSRAPDFRLSRLDGGQAALADLAAGGPILLAFFKVTCPVCQFALPFVNRLHNPSLPVYGVSQNCAEDTHDFNRQFGLSFPTLLDPEDDGFPASNAYGISSVPTLILVGRDGAVARVIEGWQRKQMEWLGCQAGVAPIRAGENVPDWKAG